MLLTDVAPSFIGEVGEVCYLRLPCVCMRHDSASVVRYCTIFFPVAVVCSLAYTSIIPRGNAGLYLWYAFIHANVCFY